MSSCLNSPSGSLSTHLHENGTGFAAGTNAGAAGSVHACLPARLRGVCERAEHADRPEPMQQAHLSTKKIQASSKKTLSNHSTPTSLKVALKRIMGCSSKEEAPLPLPFLLPLSLPSFIAVDGLDYQMGIPGVSWVLKFVCYAPRNARADAPAIWPGGPERQNLNGISD